MRLTQTSVVNLSYIKLLLIFQNTTSDITDDEKILEFITWNYFSFDILKSYLKDTFIISCEFTFPKVVFVNLHGSRKKKP